MVEPSALPHKKNKKVNKHNMTASMHVWSLEGYTLEGWKRFFMEVFLFEDSKYSHTLTMDFSHLKKVNKTVPMTNGLMTIGPDLTQNKIYQMIKSQTGDYFK